MALSAQTYKNLAKALEDEVIEYIKNDYRYDEFMSEIVIDAISHKLGKVDAEVLVNLSNHVMTRIGIHPNIPF